MCKVISLLALLWAFPCVSHASLEGGGVMLVSARIGMWSRGAKMPTAKDYVQDGLVGLWDGIENAGWGTHDANATAWADLTGKYPNTTRISNAGWTDNAKVCNGFEDLYLNGRNNSEKYEVCFRVSERSGNISYIRLGRYGSSFFDDNGVYVGTITTPFDFKIEKGELYTFADNYSRTPYMNGKILVQKEGAKPSYVGENDAQRFMMSTIGLLYCVRRYNRFLSDEEIAHNHAIDKARFGMV